MNKLTILILLAMFSKFSLAQTITPYGGYIKCTQSPPDIYTWNAVVYFPADSEIPDSIYFHKPSSHDNFNQVSSEEYIYDSIIKKTYSWIDTFYQGDLSGDFKGIVAFYLDKPVRFFGKNTDSTRRFEVIFEFLPESGAKNSVVLKDFPLLTIEKGRTSNFNLLDSLLNGDNDSVVFLVTHGIGVGIRSFSINRYTGDIYIDSKALDTGFYAVELNTKQYIKKPSNYWMESFKTRYFFTLHVVNNPVPYFVVPDNVKKDYLKTPYIMINHNDSIITYECDFVVPEGFDSLELSCQSVFSFSKQPEINWIKTSNTTAHISLKIHLNKDLKYPQGVSLMVNRKSSGGQYSQDMTSFYITRNFLDK